jgi:hypothetical protein
MMPIASPFLSSEVADRKREPLSTLASGRSISLVRKHYLRNRWWPKGEHAAKNRRDLAIPVSKGVDAHIGAMG